ncbi:MAG: membrane protein insertion efficiency factor YidD [Methyloligellaceae bacterium]
MSAAKTVARALFLTPIWIYRFCVSPFTAPTCRHLPSCAEYAATAIELNGAWKGSWLTLSRLLRCHPWGSHGFDPVPDLREVDETWSPWRYGRWTGRHIEN